VRDDQKDNRIYLWHIRDAIRRIESHTEGGEEDFFQSEIVQNAVLWNIGIIGEASRQVSDWLKESHPEVPWQQIIAMRNRIVHEYFNVDLNLLWQVVERNVPVLKVQVEDILRELEGHSET
jgi:uncharacterized protein with HEPN domain